MDDRGVEPLAMKLFAGIILLIMGLGVGYAVYSWALASATALRCTLMLSEPSKSVPRGENAQVEITVEYSWGTKENVTLQASGAPPGVNLSFAPPRGEPTFYSTLTITVGNNAPPGQHTITISARGAKDQVGSTPLTLTIT